MLNLKNLNRNVYILKISLYITLSPQYDLSGNAGLPFHIVKFINTKKFNNFRMFPSDPTGSLDVLFSILNKCFGGFCKWRKP